MIKTNCELPLCMLQEANVLNDFDLVLFHLLKESAEYHQWAYDQRRLHPGRLMILDNSGYEFYVKGQQLDLTEYAEYVNDLQPDYYILPDTLMDKNKTLNSVRQFMSDHTIVGRDVFNPKPMGVIQGNNEEELIECLHKYKSIGLTAVCVPFHLSFFRDMEKDKYIRLGFRDAYPNTNDDIEYAMGRVQFVIDHKDRLDDMDYVHFLGSHCPYEKKYYNDFNSMDTGYPVKLGIEGVSLFEETHKPDIIIDDFFSKNLADDTKQLIRENINKFRILNIL